MYVLSKSFRQLEIKITFIKYEEVCLTGSVCVIDKVCKLRPIMLRTSAMAPTAQSNNRSRLETMATPHHTHRPYLVDILPYQ